MVIVMGIDLSIGSTIALAGMISAITVKEFPNLHPIFSILEGIMIGAVVGFFIGLFVAKFDVLPIIA